MTARLILNLRTINRTSPSVDLGTTSYLREKMSDWEATVVGNIGNDFEDKHGRKYTYRYDKSYTSADYHSRTRDTEFTTDDSMYYELREHR